MPTTITKTIGATSSPVTPDYSTLQAWEDAITADLVAADEQWVGECLNQGEFTVNGTVLTVSGQTTDATRNIILRCAAGASFNDNANVRTNALRYNASNGVAIRTTSAAYNTIIAISTAWTRLEDLQIDGSAVTTFGISITVVGCVIKKCIIDTSGLANSTGISIVYSSATTTSVINCLLLTGREGISFNSYTTVNHVIAGNTLVANSNAMRAFTINNSSRPIITNCGVFGYGAFNNGTEGTGTGFNATDLASAPGSNNLTSLTTADQFENSTNDFRAASTGDLQAGTPDATNLADDISNQDRDDTTPWIGCWEVAAAGGGLAPNLLRSNLLHSPLLGGLV